MAPENISAAMKKFVRDTRKTMKGYHSSKINIFEAAAKISFHLVNIHPFPDFNGRLSRMIANLVLMCGDLLLSIPLRVSNKRKSQYLLALRRARGGNLKPYATLIAMNVVQTFEEMDDNLKLAGLDPIFE